MSHDAPLERGPGRFRLPRIAVSCAVQRGLAESLRDAATLSPQEAAKLLSDGPGALDVRWRPVGAEEWKGTLDRWQPARSGSVSSNAGGLFRGALPVTGWRGALRVNVTLTATHDAADATEIVVRFPFEPSAWERQIIPHLPYLQLPLDGSTLPRFAADATDATSSTQAPGTSFSPFGVLESDKAFVPWGSPDVGRYALLSPNLIPSVACGARGLRISVRLGPGELLFWGNWPWE